MSTSFRKLAGGILSVSCIASGFFISVLPAHASGGPPMTIGYQGYLEFQGAPLNEGADFEFALYGGESGGSPLWSETQSGVDVDAGFFAVSLGADTPLPTSLDFTIPYYLEVTVNGTTLSPRQQLDAVPYAHVAYGVPAYSTDPSSATIGALYLNIGDSQLYAYDGAAWNQVGGDGSAPDLSAATGTLAAAHGGTGLSASTGRGLLAGDGAGGWAQIATSSLGILTTNIAEGTNLYFTNDRAAAVLSATTTLPNITSLPGLTTLPGVQLSGILNANSHRITGVSTPSAGSDATNKDYVDSFVQGLSWQAPAVSVGSTTPPVSPATGDRYVVGVSATGAWSGHGNAIATWGGSSWSFLAPDQGFTLFAANVGGQFNYNGTAWVSIGSGMNLSATTGTLAVDRGGTGLMGAPTYGQLLLGNNAGGYALAATSSLGVALSDTTGILTVARGGTGTTTAPSLGQLLIGNGSGGYNYVATSSLGLANGAGSTQWTTSGSNIYYSTGSVGIGTTSPTAKFSVAGGAINSDTGVSFNDGTGFISLSRNVTPRLIFKDSALYSRFVYDNFQGVFRIFSSANDDGSAGTARFNIDGTTGNVGIGTSTPVAKFSVAGDAFIAGNATTTGILRASGSLSLAGAFFDGLASAGTNGMVLQTTGSGTRWVATSTLGLSGGASQWTTTGSNVYYATGNVGIGTTTPGQKLTINAVTDNGLAISNSGVGLGYLAPDQSGNLMLRASINKLRFNAGTTYFDGGNVGIGTTSPLAALQIGTYAGISSNGNDANYASNLYYNGGWKYMGTNAGSDISQQSADGSIRFFAAPAGTGGAAATLSERLTVLNGGNIGIGTTTPQQKFVVSTTASADGIYSDGTNNPSFTLSTNGTIRGLFGAVTSAGAYSIGAAVGDVVYQTKGGSLLFNTNSGGSTALYVGGSNGNVGIGTTSPVAKLDVFTNAVPNLYYDSRAQSDGMIVEGGEARLQIIASNGGTGGASIELTNAPSSAGNNANWNINHVGTSITGDGLLFKYTQTNATAQDGYSSATSAASALYLTSSGNVAVGTLAAGTGTSVCYDTTSVSGMKTLATCSSDRRVKTDIVPLDEVDTLDDLMKLDPVAFNWNPQFSNDSTRQFGLIAQEVQKVWPNLVSTTSPTALTPDGTLSINFNGLYGPIIAGVQELNYELIAISSDDDVRPAAAAFADTFFSNLEGKLVAWLADKANGIQDLYAGTTHQDELCLGEPGDETCVTKDQLDTLLQKAGTSEAPVPDEDASSSDDIDTPDDDASSTPDIEIPSTDDDASDEVSDDTTTDDDTDADTDAPAGDDAAAGDSTPPAP